MAFLQRFFSYGFRPFFLLTAVANWTSRPPVAGWPLAVLVGFWAVGRLGLHSASVSAIADLLFWSFLTALIAREVWASRNKRNYKIVMILVLMTMLDGLFHLGELQLLPALRCGHSPNLPYCLSVWRFTR